MAAFVSRRAIPVFLTLAVEVSPQARTAGWRAVTADLRNKDTPRHQPASRKLTRVPSGGAPPRVLTTSEGSGRPFSQETTDREIQAIFDRYDDESSSRGTTNPESRLSDSIPDTTFSEKSAKSQATGNDSDVGRASRPKSYVTFASPEAEQIQAEDDDDDTRSGSETMATRRRDRSLGEAQTYVEITGNPEEPGDFSEHVVAVAHSSPEGSEMTSAGDFSDVSRMITSQTDDGMSVTPYVEDDGDDPVVVHVSHSPNDEDGPGDPEGKRRSENPTKVVIPESVQDRRNDGQTIQKADSVDEAPLSEHQVNSTDVTAKDGDSQEENPEDVHQSDTAVPEGDKRE
ncbi:hypothetical protein LSH36_274g03010 [Paralvinella palmiformis]|uniref:Uncharacterized protein n=1 Tax=Paralvinella palmiformis TaxID=53620 RepID=A0AAD9JJ87_9ANNE|nr:hypothetical protein LSH36_274g03010 [Paralvinella palmiformis]